MGYVMLEEFIDSLGSVIKWQLCLGSNNSEGGNRLTDSKIQMGEKKAFFFFLKAMAMWVPKSRR
jgi:hypothetical protein